MINATPLAFLYLFYKFVSNGEGYWHSFAKSSYPEPSIWELLFAFVMKEKYNKIWNGEDWIKGG